MKPKFTPGPWHVERLVDDCGQYIEEWAVCDENTVCEETTVLNTTDRDKAYLIAAAPEMYEALEAVEEYFAACRRPNIYQNPGEIQSITAETARMLVEKALKKARGGK